MKKQTKIYNPSELFDHQLQLLGQCGLATDSFEKLRYLIPDIPYTHGDQLIPFLIVPQWEVSLATKMSHLGDKTSGRVHTDVGMVAYEDESKFTNIVEVPRGHYLALNYDSGPTLSTVKNLEHNPRFRTHRCVTQFQLKPNSRLSATMDEGIVSWLYRVGIGGETYTMLLGSRCGEDNPCLYEGQYWTDRSLTHPDSFRPCLGSQPKGLSGGNFGYATCAKRIAA